MKTSRDTHRRAIEVGLLEAAATMTARYRWIRRAALAARIATVPIRTWWDALWRWPALTAGLTGVTAVLIVPSTRTDIGIAACTVAFIYWSRSRGGRRLRERRARARETRSWTRRFPQACLAANVLLDRVDAAGNRHLDVPVVVSVTPLPTGSFRLRLVLPPGMTADDLAAASQRLASALHVCDVVIARDAEAGSADRVVATIVQSDSPVLNPDGLDEAVYPNPLPLPGRIDCTAPISLGVSDTGETVSISLYRSSVLIGGLPGYGKSVAVAQILAHAASMVDTDLVLLDPKRVELSPWRKRASKIVTGPDVARATAVLDDVLADMDARYELLAARGAFELQPNEFDEWMPFRVVVIDELADYTSAADRKAAAAFSERLRRLVALGRAAGVCVVMATQKPSSDTVPTAIRDLVRWRVACRCGTPPMSDCILGAGAASTGADASRLHPGIPGLQLVLSESSATPVRIRGYHLDRAARADVVASTSHLATTPLRPGLRVICPVHGPCVPADPATPGECESCARSRRPPNGEAPGEDAA